MSALGLTKDKKGNLKVTTTDVTTLESYLSDMRSLFEELLSETKMIRFLLQEETGQDVDPADVEDM